MQGPRLFKKQIKVASGPGESLSLGLDGVAIQPKETFKDNGRPVQGRNRLTATGVGERIRPGRHADPSIRGEHQAAETSTRTQSMPLRHELIQGNGVLQTRCRKAQLLPGQKGITTVMTSDSADLGMGESSKNRDLITERLQHLKGLVKGKVLARSIRKPVPLPELALLLGQAHSVGEINGTEPSWRHLGPGTRQRLHPRQRHGDPGGL